MQHWRGHYSFDDCYEPLSVSKSTMDDQLKQLQGKWILTLCEHNGRSIFRNIGEVMRVEDDRMYWPECGRPAAVRRISVRSVSGVGVMTSKLLGVETPGGGIFAPESFDSPSIEMSYELAASQLRLVHRNDDNTDVAFVFERSPTSDK